MSEFRRQHPIAAVTELVTIIKQNLVTLLVFFFLSRTRSDGYFLYLILGGLLITFVIGFLSWWFFKYRVHEDELQIQKGILVKKKLYLSKERIQVIDVTEGLIQRLFGLVKVEIKTAGSGTESATISAVSRVEAENLRRELRSRGEHPAEAQEIPELAADETDESQEVYWKLSTKDLVFAAFTSGNFGLIASFLGAIFGQLEQFVTEETIDYIYQIIPGFSSTSMLISLFIVILLISWLFSFLGVIFKYADFKVSKADEELVITTGLLERKHITIPFNRVQALRFVEGILRQPFGYGMLYVESAGFEQNHQAKSIVVAPYISSAELSDFLQTFFPDYDEPEFHIHPPRRALFRYIRKPNYFLLIAVLSVIFFWDYWWLLLLFLPLLIALGWLRYRDAALALGNDVIRMRFRVLARSTALLKKNRIQNLEVVSNPFQRRKQLRNLRSTAASGAGGIRFEVTELNTDDAHNAIQWLSKPN